MGAGNEVSDKRAPRRQTRPMGRSDRTPPDRTRRSGAAIPTEVLVGGDWYAVERRTPIRYKGDLLYGLFDEEKKLISIDSRLGRKRAFEHLVHELIHAAKVPFSTYSEHRRWFYDLARVITDAAELTYGE
jgi:hypothetical protein